MKYEKPLDAFESAASHVRLMAKNSDTAETTLDWLRGYNAALSGVHQWLVNRMRDEVDGGAHADSVVSGIIARTAGE